MGCPDVTVLERAPHPAHVVDHIRDCAACRDLVALIEERCEPCEAIELLLAADDLSAADARRLSRHLAVCVDCRDLALLDAEPVADPDTPQRYLLADVMGSGGMGRVYDARDQQLERRVAIKVLRADVSSEAERRFRREALITARLQHPAIVAVYEIGELQTGAPFYAMRKIRGDTLEERLRRAETEADRLALLPHVLVTAEAVAYAHSEGVIHRDIKPSNVMVGPFGETVVVDWGLAKLVDDDAPAPPAGPYRSAGADDGDRTRAGAVLGTPQYMAPEQARGEGVDQRSDVFSLGAMLYRLLAGHPPYHGEDSGEVLAQLRDGDPETIDRAAPAAPADLRAIVNKALARDPDDRYADAGAFADDLRRFQTGKLVSAHDYSTAALVRRWIGRNRALVVGVSILLAALIAVSTISVRRIVTERDRAEASRQQAAQTSVTLLEEQGRQYLLAGEPMRASVYLSAAYSAGADDPSLRHLLAQAMVSIDARALSLPDMKLGEHVGYQLAFSPDDSLIAGSTGDGVGIWEVKSGRLLRTLPAERPMSWSGDGRLLLATGKTYAGVWEARTGAQVMRKELGWTPSDWVLDRTGERIFMAIDGGLAYAVGATGELGKKVEFANNGVFSRGMTADGQFVTSDGDGVIRFWNRDLELVSTVGTADTPLRLVEMPPAMFDGAGRMVAPGPGNAATLWDLATGKELARYQGHDDEVITARFSPDGRRVLTGSKDGTARLWDADSGKPLVTLEIGGGAVNARFVAGGSRIATFTPIRGTTMIWQTTGAVRLAQYFGAAILPEDGDRFLLAGQPPRLVSVTADSLLGEVRDPVGNDNMVALPVSSADGDRLTVFDPFASAGAVIDVGSHEIIEEFERGADGAWTGTLDPDGRTRLVKSAAGAVVLRPVGAAGPELALGDAPAAVGYAEFSPDGSRLLIVASGGESGLWNVSTGARLARFGGGDDPQRHGRIAASNQRIVTARASGGAVLWDADGRRVADCAPPRGRLIALRFLPGSERFLLYAQVDGPTADPMIRVEVTLWRARDGRQLAVLGETLIVPQAVWGEADRAGRSFFLNSVIWDLESGAERVRLPGDGPFVGLASFSPDSSRLALGWGMTGGAGAQVVDVETGDVLAAVGQETGQVFQTQFDPAGERVVISALDGSLSIWDARGGGLLTRVPSVKPNWNITIDTEGKEASMNPALPVFSRRGDKLFVFGPDDAYRVWDVRLETRSPAEIAALVAENAPWRLQDGRLVPVAK